MVLFLYNIKIIGILNVRRCKSYNHIREILTYVDKLKLGETKKYNLRNYHEYNIIKNILC